jgi:hypothetical protein
LDKVVHHLSPDALFPMEGFEESDVEEEGQRPLALPQAALRSRLNPCAPPFEPTPNPEAAVAAFLQAPEDQPVSGGQTAAHTACFFCALHACAM